jgi:hypothetical protein
VGDGKAARHSTEGIGCKEQARFGVEGGIPNDDGVPCVEPQGSVDVGLSCEMVEQGSRPVDVGSRVPHDMGGIDADQFGRHPQVVGKPCVRPQRHEALPAFEGDCVAPVLETAPHPSERQQQLDGDVPNSRSLVEHLRQAVCADSPVIDSPVIGWQPLPAGGCIRIQHGQRSDADQ